MNKILNIFFISALVLASVFVYDQLGGKKSDKMVIDSSVESFRSVGKLVVFNAVLKEIVTVEKWHIGDDEKAKLWTPKKAAYIFHFDISFSYDLVNGPFSIITKGDDSIVSMPPVKIDYSIKDVKEYDEQPGTWMKMSYPLESSERNAIMQKAKLNAISQANSFIKTYKNQYENSAETIVKMLATGFGIQNLKVEFNQSLPEISH